MRNRHSPHHARTSNFSPILQPAVAAGATVVATTSSDEKSGLFQKLDAWHVLNEKESGWGLASKKLIAHEDGVDII